MKLPLSSLVMGVLGLACSAAGLAFMLGLGAGLHPLLATPGAGLAILVSGIALLLSAAFPLALRRLAQRDEERSL